MTLEMNKADYDEHLVRAISKGRLQGITCERQDENTMTIAAGDDIIRALERLKGAGVEDITDTLGAYGVEFLTPAALSHKALCVFAGNLAFMAKTICDLENDAISYGYEFHEESGVSAEARKKRNAMYEALRAYNAWND